MHKSDKTRTTKRAIAGRIWPAGRQFETPDLDKGFDELANTRRKLGRFSSSLYICHIKAMTALVEYGTRCLY